MVTAHCEKSSGDCQFVITPNASLTWRETVVFYCGICLVSLTIAVSFAVQGLWWILPFSGLELLALGTALYLVARGNARREVITLRGDWLEVHRQRHGREPVDQHRFQRAWVRIVVHLPVYRGHPTRLAIRSHGREVEVGKLLTEKEKKNLAKELGQRIGPVAQGW